MTKARDLGNFISGASSTTGAVTLADTVTFNSSTSLTVNTVVFPVKP